MAPMLRHGAASRKAEIRHPPRLIAQDTMAVMLLDGGAGAKLPLRSAARQSPIAVGSCAMPLHHLQHFLIQTTDIAGTVAWWEAVLGLSRGPHPDFGFPVEWLYLEGNDVLHITQGGAQVTANRQSYLGQESQAVSGTGVLDHVAFHATGLAPMLAKLRALGIPFKPRRADAQSLFQLFLLDPNGVKVELNFPGAEADAAGITPDIMASELPR
jgi:catechol 2,3-dioxygenase-like lactoylglutathione lyase family enzyme